MDSSQTNLVIELLQSLISQKSGTTAAAQNLVGVAANLIYVLLALALGSVAAGVASYMKIKENSSTIEAHAAAAKVTFESNAAAAKLALDAAKVAFESNAAAAKLALDEANLKAAKSSKDVAEVLVKVNGSHDKMVDAAKRMEEKILSLQQELGALSSLYSGVKGEQSAKQQQEGTLAQMISELRDYKAAMESRQLVKDVTQSASAAAALPQSQASQDSGKFNEVLEILKSMRTFQLQNANPTPVQIVSPNPLPVEMRGNA